MFFRYAATLPVLPSILFGIHLQALMGMETVLSNAHSLQYEVSDTEKR
jgi:hypothetical protein